MLNLLAFKQHVKVWNEHAWSWELLLQLTLVSPYIFCFSNLSWHLELSPSFHKFYAQTPRKFWSDSCFYLFQQMSGVMQCSDFKAWPVAGSAKADQLFVMHTNKWILLGQQIPYIYYWTKKCITATKQNLSKVYYYLIFR